MGDTFNQSHSGNGNNVINIGKVAFQLTDAHVAQVLEAIDRNKPVSVGWVGFDGSAELAADLAARLSGHGAQVLQGDRIGMRIPPLNGPIEVHGNSIMVDASR